MIALTTLLWIDVLQQQQDQQPIKIISQMKGGNSKNINTFDYLEAERYLEDRMRKIKVSKKNERESNIVRENILRIESVLF